MSAAIPTPPPLSQVELGAAETRIRTQADTGNINRQRWSNIPPLQALALLSQLGAMQEALKPFAAINDVLSGAPGVPDDALWRGVILGHKSGQITYGDLRRAAFVLTGSDHA